jgi:hypothetical protein
MPASVCYLFKNSYEFFPASDIDKVPVKVRGIYVLYNSPDDIQMDVVYIGMARGEKTGAKGRLQTHRKTKSKFWTHFSVYEVWDNIPRKQVEELEGLFRHIYRHDSKANSLNVQKGYLALMKIRRHSRDEWHY